MSFDNTQVYIRGKLNFVLIGKRQNDFIKHPRASGDIHHKPTSLSGNIAEFGKQYRFARSAGPGDAHKAARSANAFIQPINEVVNHMVTTDKHGRFGARCWLERVSFAFAP